MLEYKSYFLLYMFNIRKWLFSSIRILSDI